MRYLAHLTLVALVLAAWVVADERRNLVENKDLESPQLLSASLQSDRSIIISWTSLPYETTYLVWRQAEITYRRSTGGQLTPRKPPIVELVPWSTERFWVEVEVTHRRRGDSAVPVSEPLVERIEWDANRLFPAGALVFAKVRRYDDEEHSTWGVSSVRRSAATTQYSPPAVIAVAPAATAVQTESWGRLKRRMAD